MGFGELLSAFIPFIIPLFLFASWMVNSAPPKKPGGSKPKVEDKTKAEDKLSDGDMTG